jgi:hypothetical protein
MGDDCSAFILLDPVTEGSKVLGSARNYNSVTSTGISVFYSYCGFVLGIGFN